MNLFLRLMAVCVSALLLLDVSAATPDAPTGADLLSACQHAQRSDYQGEKGMLCIWYVTPCDCQSLKDTALPRVCLPADISHETTAAQVVSALKNQVELQSLSAAQAAARILAASYPCSD